MQKILIICKVVFLLLLALLGSQSGAFAEQVNTSVKECIENPDNCEEPAKADKQENPGEADREGVGLNAWDFFRMIFATLFVVALLYFILKFINKRSRVFKSSQIVETIGGTSLGGNRSIQMVKVGSRLLVVGVGENIQLLTEIDDPEEYRQIISEYNNKTEQLVKPSDFVTKVIERTRKAGPSKDDKDQFHILFKRQLEELAKARKKTFDEMEQKGKEGQ